MCSSLLCPLHSHNCLQFCPNHLKSVACRLYHHYHSFLEDTLITCVLPFSFFGFIYHDPSGHYFYNWLDDMPYPSSLRLPPKAIDQLFWCPIYMSVLFTCFGLVYGDSFATIGSMIKNNLLSTCQSSWKVWPIVHLINFKFISIKWRIPCSFYLLEHC